MVNFREFMEHLSQANGLHQTVKGTLASIQVTFPMGTNALIEFDKINDQKRAYIRAGIFVTPITKDARQRFMNMVMDFNRNAVGTMNAGLAPAHANHSEVFTLTWYVPEREQPSELWESQMCLFEQLAMAANERLTQVYQPWTH